MGAISFLMMGLLAGAVAGEDIDTDRQPPQRVRSAFSWLQKLKTADERYDPIPLSGNIDAILKQLLANADEDEDLADLLTRLRQNQDKFNLSAEQLANLEKLVRTDSAARGKLLDMARKYLQIREGELTADHVAGLQRMLESLKNGELGAGSNEGANVPLSESGIDDRFAEWTRDLLKDLDKSRVGEFMRESPAWQNALRDLEQAARMPGAKFDWLGRVNKDWKLPQGWSPRWSGWTGRLPSLPNLPRVRFSPPNLGRFSLNLGGAPNLGAPSLGGGTASVSDGLFWALVLLLLALLAWFFYYKLGRTPVSALTLARLGPWPVDPAQVTTRTQLVQAFDYLALLLLGEEVRTWNHVAVANKLGAEATRSPAAGALAQIYELARYTPGDDLLSPDAQAAARRHLLALAGSAAA